MKLSKKVITLLAAVLVFTMLAPFAAATGSTSTEAGKSVTLTFVFADVYNVDGSFSVSDPSKILTTYSFNVEDAGATAALVNGDRLWASPVGEPVKTTVKVSFTATVKGSAAVGATCTVSFSGIYGDANGEPGNENDMNQSATITVADFGEDPVVVSPVETTPPAITPDPTPEPTETPVPPVGGSSIDYTELQKQIDIASGLKTSEYTDESRADLAAALGIAKTALSSEQQNTVTAAAEELRATVAGLVRMDYSALSAALSRADALMDDEVAAILWQELSNTADGARALMKSGDQDAVIRAAVSPSCLPASLSRR